MDIDNTKTNTNKSFDSNSLELLNFINKEKNPKKVNFKKIFRFFSKCLKKSISEMQNKFNDLSIQGESIISGINMIYHIYFILVSYTNNIKLTIFLLERAILLYSEFIIMSQDKKMVDEIYFVPNINDAVSFSFKKTIGPIILSEIDGTNSRGSSKLSTFNSKFLKEASIVLRNIYKLFFRTKWINEETSFINLKIEENIETIDKLFQDKKIISDRDLDEFKKYSALCTEQSIREEQIFMNNNFDLIDSDNEINSNPKYTENYKITLNDFLNIINNEIVESLLALNTNQDYVNILKKINCIITNSDSISDKLGKIKLILFIFNKEYLSLGYNKTLFNNETYSYLIKLNENILSEELRERIFDDLVYFNFTNKFKHNIKNDPEDLSINIKYIEKQLDELLNFTK
jgi:hypothetical protein